MRSTLLALSLLLSPQDGPPAVRVEGARLVDGAGREVRLRGVSLADPDAMGADYTRERFETLAKAWKANAVRIPVLPGSWKAKGAARYDKLLDDGIEWCREFGMAAIVDWQAAGNPKTGKAKRDKPEFDPSLDLARAFWKHAAPRLKDKPWVLCSVFSEPMQVSWEEFRPAAAELAGIVHDAAPGSVAIVSGPDSSYDLRGPGAQPLDGKNTAYAWRIFPVRGTSWDSYTAELRKKAPVLAIEWGYDLQGDATTLGSTGAFGVPLLNFMEAEGIHWTAACGPAGTPCAGIVRAWLAGVRPKGRPALKEVNDFAYWLQKIDLQALGASKFDLCVIDPANDGKEFTRSEIDLLKWSPGGPKLVLAYLSIGEAEDYRTYWKKEWGSKPPEWMGPENREWKGNFKVRYWDEAWQKIALDQLEKIQAQGFDGAYLDIIDAWEFWQKKDKDDRAKPRMVEWVTKISQTAKRRDKAFLVFPQNGEELLENPAYLAAIDGIGREETYFMKDRPQRSGDIRDAEVRLEKAAAAGKKVLQIEYVKDPGNVDWVYERSRSRGFVPYVTVRDLDRLVVSKGHEPD